MVSFKRRRMIEGWELDVDDPQAEEKQMSLLKRFSENNRIWAISLVVVVLSTGLFMKFGQRGMSKAQQAVNEPPPARSEYGNSAEYDDFARAFVESKAHNSKVIEARFYGPSRFHIIVPADISSDDIDYMSQIAAQKIVHRFHHRAVILVYMRSANGDEKLVSTTMWDSKKYGFIVKYGDPSAENVK